MYQIQIQVVSTVGGIFVKAVVCAVMDDGSIEPVGEIPARVYDGPGLYDDVLTDCFVAVKRWSSQMIDPGRVVPGVSFDLGIG